MLLAPGTRILLAVKLVAVFEQCSVTGYSYGYFAVLLGKRANLMASSLSAHPLFSEFLQSNDNQYLSWLHDTKVNNSREVVVVSTIVTV